MHDVAPVARRVADGEEDRPPGVARGRRMPRPPRIPVDGVVGVEPQIGRGLVGETVGHGGLPGIALLQRYFPHRSYTNGRRRPDSLGEEMRSIEEDTMSGELVLVTGGSGFIGAHCILRLLRRRLSRANDRALADSASPTCARYCRGRRRAGRRARVLRGRPHRRRRLGRGGRRLRLRAARRLAVPARRCPSTRTTSSSRRAKARFACCARRGTRA